MRRHKSTREVSLPRSESTRRVDEKRGLTRSGTTRGSQRNPTVSTSTTTPQETVSPPTTTEPEETTYAKGSLLAKEEERHEEQQQTLIQIDDRIKFAKGSLLDKKENPPVPAGKMTRSKSVREVSSTNNSAEEQPSSRRHVSLRRKPTNKKHHDVPLPNTTPMNNTTVSTPNLPPPAYSATSANTTLLRLDDTPERFHSRELHGRHVKPLLNFDSNEKSSVSRK